MLSTKCSIQTKHDNAEGKEGERDGKGALEKMYHPWGRGRERRTKKEKFHYDTRKR